VPPVDLPATQRPEPVRGPLAPFLANHSGRARFSVEHPRPADLPDEPVLLAGAAEVDLTPPPGLPKAGYSRNARTGTGFRTRLRARVLHLRAGRSSIALVACDLLGGSSVVQHLVAEAVSERTDIPLAGLMIGATHTHAGPGQFLGTDFYNRFASNKPGFDPVWTQHLVDRIAGAVIEAHDSRAPAVLAVGSREVWGLTRNRSLDPHVTNENVTDRRLDPQRKWVSVNPRLHLVRVDRLDGAGEGAERRPLAAMAVFSVHGTGVPQHSDDYNADLWAYVCGELSFGIEERAGSRAVVGAVEGTHADVAPALRPGLAGHLDAKRVGRGIGAEATELWADLEAQLTGSVALGAAFKEIDLDRERSADGAVLAPRAAVGAALVAGAMENLTPVIHRIPPFKAGHPKRARAGDPHAQKWVLGSRWLQPLIVPPRSFPRLLPMQLLRIGGTVVAGLPFEITTETGRRLAAATTEGLGDPGLDVVVSSVANEYTGYAATPEEYTRQFYEGGHTIYGPATQPFLAAQLRRLAGRLATATGGDGATVDDTAPKRSWDLKIHRWWPEAATDGVTRRWEGQATFTDPTAVEEGYWEQTWVDVAPAALAWDRTLVRIEASDDDGEWFPEERRGRPVDDGGWDIGVRCLGPADRGGALYRVRWYDPVHKAGRRHRFVLVADAGRPEVASPAFS
jgi:neutral ceramidase